MPLFLGLIVALLLHPAAVAFGQPVYVLGPEDILEISVVGFPDLARTVTVRPDGRITLPLIGSIQAAGRSVEQLTAALVRAYSAYIKRPLIAVSVKEFRKIRVSVLGQVIRPGLYSLSPGSRLLDAMAAAGGPTESAGDISMIRTGESPISIDLNKALSGDPQANLPLIGGETVVVNEDTISYVYLFGEIMRPGRYRLKGEMRLLDALSLAGGLTERAGLALGRLSRNGVSRPLELDRLLLRQEMTLNLTLKPGDTITIPDDPGQRFYVVGDVSSPGAFPLRGEVTLLQALSLAGGPLPRGAEGTRTVHIVRRGDRSDYLPAAARTEPMPNGATLITLPLRLTGRDTSGVVIRPGDVIVVPQTGIGALQVFLGILSGLVGYIR